MTRSRGSSHREEQSDEPTKPIRVAVVGAGEFGRNHVRVWREMEGAELVGIVDTNAERAAQVAAEFGDARAARSRCACRGARGRREPRRAHERARAHRLPAARCRASTCWWKSPWPLRLRKPTQLDRRRRSAAAASCKSGTWNASIQPWLRCRRLCRAPLFFEVHRLGVFTPRSLDIDVVYDVMIHDLDILLALVDAPVTDLKAVGIPVITDKVDIAQARVEFATGTVANVTASRVSTERVRKMRFFQAHEYISLDFTRQDVLRVRVRARSSCRSRRFNFENVPTTPEEPLQAELRAFLGLRAHAPSAGRGRRGRAPRAGAGRPGDGRHPGTCAARPTGRLSPRRKHDR